MPYENDCTVVAWFEHALAHELPAIRRSAVGLLRMVAVPQRVRWLERAMRDPDSDVAWEARLTLEILGDFEEEAAFELMESDLGDSLDHGDDLGWQWEYGIVVCPFGELPLGQCLAWTRGEDDQAARKIALLKMAHRLKGDTPAAAVIVAKSLVNQYTRSPRSFTEAVRWHSEGRPRYRERE